MGTSTDRLIQDGELVLLDMGTEVRLAAANSSKLGCSPHSAACFDRICCALRCQTNIPSSTMCGASRLAFSSRLLSTCPAWFGAVLSLRQRHHSDTAGQRQVHGQAKSHL